MRATESLATSICGHILTITAAAAAVIVSIICLIRLKWLILEIGLLSLDPDPKLVFDLLLLLKEE